MFSALLTAGEPAVVVMPMIERSGDPVLLLTPDGPRSIGHLELEPGGGYGKVFVPDQTV